VSELETFVSSRQVVEEEETDRHLR